MAASGCVVVQEEQQLRFSLLEFVVKIGKEGWKEDRKEVMEDKRAEGIRCKKGYTI